MNNKIKELAEQAKFAINVSDDPNSPPYWWAAGHNNIFEKFAELIVLEVFSKIEDERYEMYQPTVDVVKAHFGIK